MLRAAFPDLHQTIEEQIAEGDKVAYRWTARGTHLGELMGIAPTGNRVMFTGISIAHLAEGKIEEIWENYDALGMMQQLGVIPSLA
jgi:predicted ester cyclase